MELLQRSIRAARWVPHVVPAVPVDIEPAHKVMASPSILPSAVIDFTAWPQIRNIGQCCNDYANQAARYPQPFKKRRGPPIALVQRAICIHFGLSRADLISSSRHPVVCLPRQIAMWICRTSGKMTYPEIGRAFGGRDHTTVIKAFRKVERLRMEGDTVVCEALQTVSISLKVE